MQARGLGLPMMRAMMLEFPGDPSCHTLDRQYLLGDSLLVAPVFRADGLAEYYLPEGVWTELQTKRTVVGPTWLRETHDVLSVPLFVRPGTLLATGQVHDRPDSDYGELPTLTLYALDDGQEAVACIPRLDGEKDFSVRVRQDGDRLHLSRSGRARPYLFRVAGGGAAQIGAETATLPLK